MGTAVETKACVRCAQAFPAREYLNSHSRHRPHATCIACRRHVGRNAVAPENPLAREVNLKIDATLKQIERQASLRYHPCSHCQSRMAVTGEGGGVICGLCGRPLKAEA